MNYKIIKYQFYNLIIVLVVPTLILGPFIQDLIVSLSSLYFLFYLVKNKELRFFNNIPFKFFFIFCVYCIFCSLFSKDILLSFESSLFYFRIGVFSCFIWFLIEKDLVILKYFYYSLLFSFLILFGDGLFQYINGTNIYGLPILGNRISSFFGDELVMGSFLSRLMPLLLALFLIKKKKKYEVYLMPFIIILSGVMIFLSAERTSFAFYILSLFLLLLFTKKFKKIILVSIISTGVILSLITINNPTLKDRMIDKVLFGIGLKEGSDNIIFTNAHTVVFKTAFKMFKDKPITGHGPKMFRVLNTDPKYYIDKNSQQTHPHNYYIQLLVETGIIGFSFLIFVFIFVCKYFLFSIKSVLFNKNRIIDDYQIYLLICFFVTLWPFSPNGNFFNNWLSIVYSLPVGFYLHSIFGKNKYKIINGIND